MKLLQLISLLMLLGLAACGSKKPSTKTGEDNDTDSETTIQQAEAKGKIEHWLGEAAAKKISKAAKKMAEDVAEKTVASEEVTEAISYLISEMFKQKDVKKKIDKIADKATSGVKNKLTLLGKAIISGGASDYKKKVTAKGTEVAKEILEERLQNEILKDERMNEVIRKLLPLITIQGKLAAATLQSNLSPKVSQKIFTLALTLSVEGKSDETAQKVEEWISQCEGYAEDEMADLLKKIGKMKSLQKAMQSLAVEVLKHPTMIKELAAMTLRILENDEAYDAAVAAYEYVALDKGEDKIKSKMQTLFELPVIDDELFRTLNLLAEAEGANAIIEKHLAIVSEDKEMAELIDDFLVSLLVTCGDLSVK
ncbi:MAG: hypothetical protein JXX29_00120 [Deltaproteobacteria bacterium]|nr:hypothetical protein [Deltaproteobacteria bacterium]MBN2670040.1 hypothetical protein [Deltaproteobacteria bacterium]